MLGGFFGNSPVPCVLENTSPATGGQEAETIEHAKKYAPLTFKRQDRLVSLEDFNTFANNFRGPIGNVGKARAVTSKAYSSGNIIEIYLLEKASNTQLQKASSAFKSALLNAIEPKRLITTDIIIVDGLIRTLD